MDNINRCGPATVAANQTLLPSHLCRMVSLCMSGDYQSEIVRERIKKVCIPRLNQHRREVLVGSYLNRHCRPEGYVSNLLYKAWVIRQALSSAHEGLRHTERSNVIAFPTTRKAERCESS